jgi:hypothetical protein
MLFVLISSRSDISVLFFFLHSFVINERVCFVSAAWNEAPSAYSVCMSGNLSHT